ncbi:MAG: beta-lactamase family protein [Solobacterium sp.]|nr:beta-lactamase family protein [Solobacterium sp.]
MILSEEKLQQAEDLIRTIMEECEASGLTACILDQDGRTVYEKSFGFRDKENLLPIDGDTLFGLASVTKSFTALAIMKMQEDGLLSVNDPLSCYLPEFTNHNTETVRLAHLLSHSGGFFPQERITVMPVASQLGLSEDRDHDLARNEQLAAEGGRLVAERLNSLQEGNGLIAEPGRYCSYCNDGFGLLSEVIRRYGDQPSYDEYVRKHILQPLHMERSFCDFIRPSEDDNAAVLYQKKDGVMTHHRDYHDDAFVLNGGGAMKSSLNDLKKYLTMYLHHGEGVCTKESIAEMLKERIPFGIDGYYGYGLYTQKIGPFGIFQHGGSLPGVSSNILFSYDAACAIIVLCNTSDVPVSRISDALFMAYTDLSEDIHKPYPEAAWSAELCTNIQGEYQSGEGTSFAIREENGSLILKSEDSERTIQPISDSLAIVRGKWSDTVLEPITNEKRGLFAVRYGSRVIPKIL